MLDQGLLEAGHCHDGASCLLTPLRVAVLTTEFNSHGAKPTEVSSAGNLCQYMPLTNDEAAANPADESRTNDQERPTTDLVIGALYTPLSSQTAGM